MLRSETLFGKRENNIPSPLPVNNTSNSLSSGNNSPGIAKTGLPPVMPPSGSHLVQPGSISDVNETGSKLIVGPNIKLKGVEITDCDTLVVEGLVEATMDSRVIQIAEKGAFKGSAEIDLAEIRGEFNGELLVRQKLTIYSTGKVSGKIHYGKLVIEEGGQLSGDVQVGSLNAAKNLNLAKTA